jgi:hypothetical protein
MVENLLQAMTDEDSGNLVRLHEIDVELFRIRRRLMAIKKGHVEGSAKIPMAGAFEAYFSCHVTDVGSRELENSLILGSGVPSGEGESELLFAQRRASKHRVLLAAQLPTGVLDVYESHRGKLGLALSPVENGSCRACWTPVKGNWPGEVLLECTGCSRILYSPGYQDRDLSNALHTFVVSK